MFDIKFSANGEVFTYTSLNFENENQVKSISSNIIFRNTSKMIK